MLNPLCGPNGAAEVFGPQKGADAQGVRQLSAGLAHWADLMQVVLSIREGRLSSPLLLRRLGTESRKNNVYKAFCELGRVIRTITLLRFVFRCICWLVGNSVPREHPVEMAARLKGFEVPEGWDPRPKAWQRGRGDSTGRNLLLTSQR